MPEPVFEIMGAFQKPVQASWNEIMKHEHSDFRNPSAARTQILNTLYHSLLVLRLEATHLSLIGTRHRRWLEVTRGFPVEGLASL